MTTTVTPSTLHINPNKLTIDESDLLDCSDLETSEDEWVTVSSSSTTSTTSTLPEHLMLNPKRNPQAKIARPAIRSTTTGHANSSSSALKIPPPKPLPVTTNPVPSLQAASARQCTRLSPVKVLRSHIPSLTTIYLTSSSCLNGGSSGSGISGSPQTTDSTANHLASLLPQSSPSPIQLHSASPHPSRSRGSREAEQETYLRVCASCFLPNRHMGMKVFCDGTWEHVSAPQKPETCSVHANTFSLLPVSCWLKSSLRSSFGLTNGDSTSGMDNKGWRWKNNNNTNTNANTYKSTSGRCTHGPSAACPDCPAPASTESRDERDLLGAIMKAVAPFERIDTERGGIRVVDMTGPAGCHMYMHKEGCECNP